MFTNLQALAIPQGNVVKIESGSTVLWEKVTGLLPSAYQQVEYVQTDGNQYIDTGVKASDYQDGLEYVFEGVSTAESLTKRAYLFGCLASSKRSCNISVETNLTRMVAFIGNDGNALYSWNVSANESFTLRAKGTSVKAPDFIITYNNTQINNKLQSSNNTDMPAANIYLLACNLNGGYTSGSSGGYVGRMYSFTMSDMNGKEIRHFIPCYRKSDGVIGLYDIVESKFYTNSGSGSFTKSADV